MTTDKPAADDALPEPDLFDGATMNANGRYCGTHDGYTEEAMRAAIARERERWIGGVRIRIPTEMMEHEINQQIRLAIKKLRAELDTLRQQLADAVHRLQYVAAVAHNGGFYGLSVSDALVTVRRLTQDYFDRRETPEQASASVRSAIAAGAEK